MTLYGTQERMQVCQSPPRAHTAQTVVFFCVLSRDDISFLAVRRAFSLPLARQSPFYLPGHQGEPVFSFSASLS